MRRFFKSCLLNSSGYYIQSVTEAIIQNTDGSIAYNLAQQDMVALRCVMRLGVQIAIPATRRKGVNGYPFAVLTPEKASA